MYYDVLTFLTWSYFSLLRIFSNTNGNFLSHWTMSPQSECLPKRLHLVHMAVFSISIDRWDLESFQKFFTLEKHLSVEALVGEMANTNSTTLTISLIWGTASKIKCHLWSVESFSASHVSMLFLITFWMAVTSVAIIFLSKRRRLFCRSSWTSVDSICSAENSSFKSNQLWSSSCRKSSKNSVHVSMYSNWYR